MVTVHSTEEELGYCFYIKEEIVNKYKTQIILTNNKVEKMRIIKVKELFLWLSQISMKGKI